MGCGASAQTEIESDQNKKSDEEKENVQETDNSEQGHKNNGTISKPNSASRRSAKVQPASVSSELPVLPRKLKNKKNKTRKASIVVIIDLFLIDKKYFHK